MCHFLNINSFLMHNSHQFLMSTRIPRLWQPGCPRPRVFLPDFWIKFIEWPTKGHSRLPKNVATFEVDKRMSKLDVREYLEKIYKYPVRDVRIFMKEGEITWDHPKDREKRIALWKEEDQKIAFVFFRKDFIVEIPNLFPEEEGTTAEIEKMKKYQDQDLNTVNQRYINKHRGGVGEMLPI